MTAGTSQSKIANLKSKNANGGEGGIRTHGGLSPTPVFETGALIHYATSPKGRMKDERESIRPEAIIPSNPQFTFKDLSLSFPSFCLRNIRNRSDVELSLRSPLFHPSSFRLHPF